MSVGLGQMERRVLKILEWEKARTEGWGRLSRNDSCTMSYGDVVGFVIHGCNDKDWTYLPEDIGKVYRAVYQSVCRAIRSLERKGFVKTAVLPGGDISGYGWCKLLTLIENGHKHLDTKSEMAGVNT